jgi:mono/diheme cytochrome c family protein/glucose/arabinose dehydrogenase
MYRKPALLIFVCILLVIGCTTAMKTTVFRSPEKKAVNLHPSAAYLSPEETIHSITLPEGYHLELVASEPMISEPVAVVWDANGRLFVAEMRTYMQDIEATGENLPTSRISLLEDTNGDGKMDKSTVFIDSLVLPRMILPLKDRLIVAETYTGNLYSYRDTNADGKADEKILVYKDDQRDNRNLEHQESGLIWNIDNWIYVSNGPIRYRFENGKLRSDTLPDHSRGQWGLTYDNYGRLFYSAAGSENPVFGFQQNPAYGELEFYRDQWEKGFEKVWPAIATPDVEGGAKRLRGDSTLNHFTGACGQSIYRGNRLPADLVGDYIIPEPVGRLIRRARVTNQNGKRVLKNAYEGETEFLTSTDMNFRPVNTATGPDGCLYIVDMYRGIIQEGTWTGPKSYLRPQILSKKLDKNIGRGRIYRLVHDDYKPDRILPLLKATDSQLVSYLSHANGWVRDNAQVLLISRNAANVIPDLRRLVEGRTSFLSGVFSGKKEADHLGRLHALWTLEGLGYVEKDFLKKVLQDEHPQLRRAAIRILEPYLKKGDKEVQNWLKTLKDDPDYDVRIQITQSLRFVNNDKSRELLAHIINQSPGNEMLNATVRQTLGVLEMVKPLAVYTKGFSAADSTLITKGSVIFKELCSTCHGADGKGIQLGESGMAAPPLSGSARVRGEKDILINIVMYGLMGPVDGKTYPGMMPEMKSNNDEWLASVTSYIRTNLDNSASVVSTADVTRIRKTVPDRWAWTLKELGLEK